ncbi:MAG: CDP-glucose 4,6-dehydratase [Sedimentisphaerales bacterium]|nr:CDP-glucose 4,6-dehydratase [Sedimentisphaerales bacterium]
MFDDFYRNKKVLITGHTGFKGSWLSEWLLLLGAYPIGYSLEPETNPSLFKQLNLEKRLEHQISDIRCPDILADSIQAAKPDIIFHMAAQALVRQSYVNPSLTYETNVLGTVYLLNALRFLEKPCAVVIITSDKCYENHEWLYGYRENDPLGGRDPYSSSKACAELAVQSFRQSFFMTKSSNQVAIASARAGNVIGGGDWARDRILPDCIRALSEEKSIVIRNPNATRPWQHVLEPLSGYLVLAQHIYADINAAKGKTLCSSFNFGPSIESNQSVESLVKEVCRHWPGKWKIQSGANEPHEANLLSLNTDKAWHYLGWRPVWDFETTVKETMHWYREKVEHRPDAERTAEITRKQILAYHQQAKHKRQKWADKGEYYEQNQIKSVSPRIRDYDVSPTY